MAALTINMSDESLARFRAAFTQNQGMEKAATDDQLVQQLLVHASAITYQIEIAENGGDKTKFVNLQ